MPNHPIRAAAAATVLALVAAGCSGPEAAERVGGARTPAPLAGGTPGPSGAATAATPARPATAGEPRTLAEGLRVPWGIAFLPDGDALVTERNSARVVRVGGDGRVTEAGVIEGVRARGEGGLLGIAVSPRFEQDRYVFVYHTAADDNRIVRYRYEGDRLSDPKVIVSGIPSGVIHNGGRLEFGPDGHP